MMMTMTMRMRVRLRIRNISTVHTAIQEKYKYNINILRELLNVVKDYQSAHDMSML